MNPETFLRIALTTDFGGVTMTKAPVIPVLCFCICLPACISDARNAKKPMESPSTHSQGQASKPIKDVQPEVVIADTTRRSAAIETKTGPADLIVAYFVDQENGWVGGGNAIFRTSDAGSSWEPVNLQIPAGAGLAAINFVNSKIGWVVAQKVPADRLNYLENKYWLFHTVDAGATWRLQHEGYGARITTIRFINEQQGWMAGCRYLGLEPYRFTNFVMWSTDEGSHWLDLSDRLIQHNEYKRNRNDIVTDINLTNSSEIFLLTGNGRMLKTEDNGRSWKQINLELDESGWPFYTRLGVTVAGNHWFVGSAESSRGNWGILLMEEKERWVRYSLDGILLSDASIMNDEILACGSLLDRNNDKSQGVVLHSSNGGRTWSVIYRSSVSTRINALVSIGADTVGVGNGGLIVRLQTASRVASRINTKKVDVMGDLGSSQSLERSLRTRADDGCLKTMSTTARQGSAREFRRTLQQQMP
jgi:photosystem II stability/assembly factor-like uncharacterized protein